MLLKTYRAPDLATALAKARAELGPNALVLATSEKAGRFGLDVVEVTVGTARETAGNRSGEDETVKRLAGEIRELRRSFESPEKVETPATAREPETPIAPRPRAVVKTEFLSPPLQAAVKALVVSGLTTDLATRFARIASTGLPSRPDAGAFANAAARGMEGLLSFTPIPLRSRCLFVVGPPGSGKTTTVAKLAARAAAAPDRPVFIAEADGERVGAIEQAEIYCRHLGAVLARVDGPDDLRYAMRDAGDRGVVVVDTPGIGSGDHDRAEMLVALRRCAPDAEVAVLVPAGLHHKEASRVIRRFGPLRPTCVGFSRLDDGARPGELVTALAASGLPLAFLTNGHGVPQDLDTASPRGLAALLLRSGQSPEKDTETHS